MTIHEIFNQIEHAAGTTEKSAILLNNMNDTIVKIYQDCYDSQLKYGVHKFKILPIYGAKTIDKDYDYFHDLLTKLAKRELTGNAAIDAVEVAIAQFVNEDKQILAAILNKKLTIGLSWTTFKSLTGVSTSKPFEVTLACHLENVKGVNPIDGTWFASRKCDGCVSGDTLVELEDGTKLPISEVIQNKLKGKIKSFDEKTGKIVYSNIEDWMHNVEDVNSSQKQWFMIELSDGRKLKITGNDSLYVKDKGWVKVENLTENDEIMIE